MHRTYVVTGTGSGIGRATASLLRSRGARVIGVDVTCAEVRADLSTPDGDKIPIEERDQREVSHLGASRLTPVGALIRNPAFDVTPHRYISGIITERGIFRAPFGESLKQAFEAVAVKAV